ncbi:hypothetical protein LOD99_3473 [Oopsacas minuta]|uniref:SRCR domain-containing protein n=1 Tax=Oopsacas minuta TaxID=111878 RepID=A0AAV7JX84_9METZ|nr:hypothetical protein LOD99_3473 [Oopsacas minuta]
MILIFILSVLCFQSYGQDNYNNFRYNANGLQLYINGGFFYIQITPTFSYIEASQICREYFRSSFLRFDIVNLLNLTAEVVTISCEDENTSINDCAWSNLVGEGFEVINITCLDAGLEGRTIKRLVDGSIAVSTTIREDYYIWGHFCYYNTDGWDNRAATLACRSLGYNGVAPGKEKLLLVKPVVFGLEHINCIGVNTFEECTFIPADAKGRCESDKVFQVQCDNDVTPIPTSPTVIHTATIFGTTPRISTSITYRTSTVTVKPTNIASAYINWMIIGAGILVIIILLSIGIMIVLVLCCCHRITKTKPPLELTLDHLYSRPNLPATLRTRSEQVPPPQQYYVLP